MCLAIVKPRGLHIPEKNLRAGFDSNNDGCGLCWAENGQLHIEKGMLTWDAFLGLFQQHQDHPMLIHFRKSTHGKKNADNCHPFLFNDGELALIHNGVIPIKCSEDGFSDTWHLVNKVLEPLVKDYGIAIDDPALSWLIKVAIGSDKIAVMDGNGEFVIFNEDKGNWEDADGPEGKKGKVWYSNRSFQSYGNTTHRQYAGQGYCPGQGSIHQHANSQCHTISDDARTAPENQAEWEGFAYTKRNGQSTPLGGTDTQIATDENRGPGKMTEYGWYDKEIEDEIESVKKQLGMQRDDAIIQVFNNA